MGVFHHSPPFKDMQNILKLLILICLQIQLVFSCKKAPENFLTGKSNDPVDLERLRTFVGNYVSKYSITGKRFEKWTRNNASITYQDWFYLRNQDGALCRDDTDCNWIQEDLVCHDTCLKPYSNKWFLGDYRSIKGRCDCPKFYFWDDTDMECKSKIVRF